MASSGCERRVCVVSVSCLCGGVSVWHVGVHASPGLTALSRPMEGANCKCLGSALCPAFPYSSYYVAVQWDYLSRGGRIRRSRFVSRGFSVHIAHRRRGGTNSQHESRPRPRSGPVRAQCGTRLLVGRKLVKLLVSQNYCLFGILRDFSIGHVHRHHILQRKQIITIKRSW